MENLETIKEEVEKMEEKKIELISQSDLEKLIIKGKSLFEKKNKDLEKKIYEVDLTAEGIKFLKEYFEFDVNWEWSQSIGIVEINKALKSVTVEKPLFKALTVQAIAFHLGKYKGKGLEEATKFSKLLLVPFNNTLGNVNNDTNEIKQLGEDLGYLDMQLGGIISQGLTVEYTDKIKSIEEKCK